MQTIGPESLALERVEAIVAPFAATPLRVWLETPDGRHLAGPRCTDPVQASADVLADGSVVARVVAGGEDAAGLNAQATVVALAESVSAILDLSAQTQAARLALDDAREPTDTRVQDELAHGRRLQRSFVSLVAPDVPGYEIASHYEAAREIGGDFFDLFRRRRRGQPLSIVVADVTGKGIAAALLMAFARPLLHAAIDNTPGPAEALERTNTILVEERRGSLFVTVLAAELQPRSGQVRLANAGHEPPLIVRGADGPLESIEPSGVLLGAFGSTGVVECGAVLERGDVLVLYTDGVTDAREVSGERFGEERLFEAVEAGRRGGATGIVDAIRSAVERFQVGVEPADDVTLVAIGRVAARGRARRAAR